MFQNESAKRLLTLLAFGAAGFLMSSGCATAIEDWEEGRMGHSIVGFVGVACVFSLVIYQMIRTHKKRRSKPRD